MVNKVPDEVAAQIVTLTRDGYSVRKIAECLGINRNTVAAHQRATDAYAECEHGLKRRNTCRLCKVKSRPLEAITVMIDDRSREILLTAGDLVDLTLVLLECGRAGMEAGR